MGEGGFGCVYKAINRFDEKVYAIKKIKLSTKKKSDNDRIKKEVSTISMLHN